MKFVRTTTLGIALLASATQAQVNIKATNKLQVPRTSQTIEIPGKDLAATGARDLTAVHIKDASGKEVLAQAVDTDFDARHTPDMVIFQADFAPGETKTFTAASGPKQIYSEEQIKAHGRFVRERFDDFAWENDRIAHRMYGKSLETWEGEPLTSSSVDIWSKKTPKMVIDKWYMIDDYHADHGEGADYYSAGATRGDGANGIWAGDKLYVSRNFVDSRVLANGPIRVMFELVYDAFDAGGVKVSEVKRITLDAGSNLDHYQSVYQVAGTAGTLTSGIGLKKVRGEQVEFNAEHGWLAKWENVEKNAGQQGLAIVIDPKIIANHTEDQQNHLIIAKTDAHNSVSYYAGFCWDKSGQGLDNFDAWKKYVDAFAQGAASPIEVTVGK